MLCGGIPIAKHLRRELGARARIFSASFIEERVRLRCVDAERWEEQLDFARWQALELEQPLPASPRHRHHVIRCQERYVGSELPCHLLKLRARDWFGA